MRTYFDHFHSAIGRIMPDFGLLHVGPHKPDPRAAASIVIACMTLTLLLMVTLALTPPVRLAPAKSAGQVAPPPAADKVTIVAAPPRLDVPCAEQTWPYIDRRCLTESTQKRPEPEARTREAAAPPIDARNAATPVVPAAAPPAPAASETQGIATREAAIKPEAVEMPQHPTAEIPQRPTAYDYRDAAEQDEEMYPVLSPREWRRMERMERRRAAHERRMRHQWHPQFFPRIY